MKITARIGIGGVILALFSSTLEAQKPIQTSKVSYIKMDSIGKRGVWIGWEDVELYTDTKTTSQH